MASNQVIYLIEKKIPLKNRSILISFFCCFLVNRWKFIYLKVAYLSWSICLKSVEHQQKCTRAKEKKESFSIKFVVDVYEIPKTSINVSTDASTRLDDKIYTIFLFLRAKIHFHNHIKNNNSNNMALFFLVLISQKLAVAIDFTTPKKENKIYIYTIKYIVLYARAFACMWVILSFSACFSPSFHSFSTPPSVLNVKHSEYIWMFRNKIRLVRDEHQEALNEQIHSLLSYIVFFL